MAHFAKLGSNSKVIQVLTLDNKDMLNADGVEDESVGQQYLERHNNWPAQMWIQTSYNTSGGTHKDGGTPLRGNYAGVGYTWMKTIIYSTPKNLLQVGFSIFPQLLGIHQLVTLQQIV